MDKLVKKVDKLRLASSLVGVIMTDLSNRQ